MNNISIIDVTIPLAKRYLATYFPIDFDAEWSTIEGRIRALPKQFNRKIKWSTVNAYAYKMSIDQWEFCGDTLKFNRAGVLMDGQHRLLAMLKSNRSQRFGIVNGLSQNVFAKLDTGTPREAAGLLDCADSTLVASAARYLFFYEQRGTWSRMKVRQVDGNCLSRYADNDDVLNTVESYPELIERSHEVRSWLGRTRGVARGLLVALYVIILRENATQTEAVETFFRRVCKGESIHEGDPEWCLHSRLSSGISIGDEEMAGLFLKVWRARCLNKKVYRLIFLESETMPEIYRL